MNTTLILNRNGVVGGPLGDSLETVPILPDSRIRFGVGGGTVSVPITSYLDPFALLPVTSASGAALAAGVGLSTLTYQVALADLGNAAFLTTYKPGYNFKIIAVDFITEKAVTTGAKAATVTPSITGVNVTGGVVALTSAACTPSGTVVAGSAVTAANTGGPTDTITLTASAVTAFVEGSGSFAIRIQNMDTANALALALNDPYLQLIGTNTPLATQATKGGLTLTTGGTNTNQAGVAGVATTVFKLPITVNGMMVWRTRVTVPSLTTVAYYSAGLNQNPTDVDPTATAGEGVTFLADPTNVLTATTGATAAQALNWIIASKVAGADTFIFTGIPILAGVDVGLRIQLNGDLTATCAIEGVTAGTSPALVTAAATLSALVGVRTAATATATMDVRYVEMGRLIG